MLEFFIAFAVFALAVAGMAVGVILRRKCLTGTCGGLANLRDEQGNSLCEACTNPSPDCIGENADTSRDRQGAGSGATRPGSVDGERIEGTTGGSSASAGYEHVTAGRSLPR